jgi:PKHD-type hydroxylase
VTSGVRLVAVTWFQSMVRGASERRILVDLASSLDALERQGADGEALLRLRSSYNNLLRLWLEP